MSQKICLVTGASRGIGRAVAEALGRSGAQVVAVARTVGGLEEVDDAIQRAGGPAALLVPLDLTDGDGVDRLGAALFERFGRVDLLVHAAAQAAPLSPVAHATPKDMEAAVAVNVLATHRLIRSIDPLLRQAEAPQAVFFTHARAGQKFWGAYGASKAAMAALAQSYDQETPKVRVTLFEPPASPTALRGRTHPGDDGSTLPPVAETAARLLEEIGWRR